MCETSANEGVEPAVLTADQQESTARKVRLGFLIDQDACIGCHACTVACKSEHDVPLGVNRTWVKYIEKGTFPDSRRLYSVMRCNHCDNAPCVAICPTGALFTRDDGIVDFDTSRCIGCKSCLNACPYDALYIDPEEHTAQKCNFCAHRIEVGLEPACVVVCPTQAIVTGDLEDPGSRIARMIARHDVHVRAPEQGTRPKLYYKGADQASLDPLQSAIPTDGMIWAETTEDHPGGPTPDPSDGLAARTVYTTAHHMAWRGRVSAYLVTKGVAGGTLMVGALLVLLGHARTTGAVGILPPVAAGAALLLTAVLLVADLKQPRRFHYILTKPNWSSWLTRGAVILGVCAALAGVWFIAGVAGSATAIQMAAGPAAAAGAATAAYTALLFGQCEGRDLWQSPLMLPLLLAQAAAAGAAVFAAAATVIHVPSLTAVRWVLLTAVGAQAVLVALEATTHSGPQADAAMDVLIRGRFAARFRTGVVVGMVVPATLTIAALAGAAGATALTTLASVAALVGLASFEDAFVRAGQSVPLS